jgi:hypothetical protein
MGQLIMDNRFTIFELRFGGRRSWSLRVERSSLWSLREKRSPPERAVLYDTIAVAGGHLTVGQHGFVDRDVGDLVS